MSRLMYMVPNGTKNPKCKRCRDEGWHVTGSDDHEMDPYRKASWGYCRYCLAGWENRIMKMMESVGFCKKHDYIPNVPPGDCQWCQMLWDKAPKKEDWITGGSQ